MGGDGPIFLSEDGTISDNGSAVVGVFKSTTANADVTGLAPEKG
jgi:hypothetical protein